MNMPTITFTQKWDDWITVCDISAVEVWDGKNSIRVTLSRSTLMTHSIRPGVKPRLEICKWILFSRCFNCFSSFCFQIVSLKFMNK